VIELLADREQLRAQMDDIYDTYRSDGADKVMQKFLTHAGFGNAAAGDDRGALRSEPPPDQMARMRAAIEVFLGHLIRPTTRYRPDIEALRAASTRIVVGVGCEVEGTARQPSGRRARRQLGITVVDFPVDHSGLVSNPAECGRILVQLFTEAT
jgi:hypothetical protein